MTSAFQAALPGTASARPQHVPSPLSGVPEVGGKDSTEHLHRLQNAVHGMYTAHRASIPDGVDPRELADRAGEFAYSDAALALRPATEAVRRDAEAAAAEVNDGIASMGVDPTDQAAQTAALRFWTRTQATLAAALKKGIPQAVAAAQQAIAKAQTTDQLNALAEELQEWCDQNGVPSSWLPAALAGKAGRSDKVDAATIHQRRYAMLAQNTAALERAFAKNVAPQPLLDPYAVTATPYSDSSTG